MEFEIQLFRSDDIQCMSGDGGSLGSGSYGTVRLGFHKVHGIVAVKCSAMSGGSRKIDQLKKRVKREIGMIQQANHDNIVRVHGWTQWSGAIAIVMEYLPGGNLMEALDDPDIPLEPLLRLRMGYEISNAIAFLHNLSSENKLVHGDIKAENILLTEDLHCKLSDFGSARLSAYTGRSTSSSLQQHSNQFTELYASPEILENPTAKLKPPHDTYSFSVTMYVVIGRESPVLSNLQRNIYLEQVKRGHRPDLDVINDFIHELQREGHTNDAEVMLTMKKLMEECWSQNPSDRPLMIDVKKQLYDLLIRQDSVKVKQFAVNAAREMNIQKIKYDQVQCVPLHQFLAPDFNNIEVDAESVIADGDAKLKIAKRSPLPSAPQTNIARSPKDDNCKGFLAIKGRIVYFYDVATKKLERLQDTKFGHKDGSAVSFNGEVFVISGYLANSVEKIKSDDLSSGWIEVTSTNRDRSGAASAACDGYIYTIGGSEPTSLGERYDIAQDCWTRMENMTVKRLEHALVALDGKVYAIGGFDGKSALNSAECYDPVSDEWEMIPSMETKRRNFSAVALNNEIYAIGGGDDNNQRFVSVERYNLKKKRWVETASVNSPRSGHGSCVVNGKIYVVGGPNGHSIEVYDPVKDVWKVEAIFNDLIHAKMIAAV